MDGKLIGLKIDGEFVPCETNCAIKMSNEQLDASGEHNGNWKHWIEGYKSWNMSVNAKLMKSTSPAGFAKIFKKNLLPNQMYEVIIASKNNSDLILKGNAKIQDLDMSAEVDTKANYNINFIGTGALTEVVIVES